MCSPKDRNGKLIMYLSYFLSYKPGFAESQALLSNTNVVLLASEKSDFTFSSPPSESAS